MLMLGTPYKSSDVTVGVHTLGYKYQLSASSRMDTEREEGADVSALHLLLTPSFQRRLPQQQEGGHHVRHWTILVLFVDGPIRGGHLVMDQSREGIDSHPC